MKKTPHIQSQDDIENHNGNGGFSLDLDYTDRHGHKFPMMAIPKVSEEHPKLSPLRAMGSNFADTLYGYGWSDGYSHAKGDAAGGVDSFLEEFFRGDPVLGMEARTRAFAAAMDVHFDEVIWVNNHPALKSEQLAFPIRSTCQERYNDSEEQSGFQDGVGASFYLSRCLQLQLFYNG